MNHAEVSGLLSVGLHDTNGGEESCATGYPKMHLDSSYVTTPAIYTDNSNADACLNGYQNTERMSELQPVEEVSFGSTRHFEKGIVADSEEESSPSSPQTSSATNYDMPVSDYMKNLQNLYDDLGEMADQEGVLLLNPDYVMCDNTMHLQSLLSFSSDGFKIEHLDLDSCDDERIALYWDISDIISIGCKWTQSVATALVTLVVESSAESRNSGIVRVEFCLTDSQWPRKQQMICHLASRYQEIWNNIPPDDFASENWSIEPSLFFPKHYFSGNEDFEDVIYPKGDHDAVSVSSRDVELLLPETFVNDTIIDFYIKYLRTRIDPAEKSRYHFFNSFFFRKLADLDKDEGRAPEGRTAFLRVRKWTRKIDVFAKDFLFIPVNFNLHWSLIVICYPGEVDTFEDGNTKTARKLPCILHMDSYKGSHTGLKDIIQSYLWEEWKERHPESASDSSDKFLNMRFFPLELPQQENSFDCGLFLLHYVELFLMDAPSSFNPLKIDVFSSFLGDDWFPPADASLKRSLIRKLIYELVLEPSKTYPKLLCGNEPLDERHHRYENRARELAGEFLSQECSAGESDPGCTILATQQQSASVCLNDSERELPVSGCIVNRVSMVALQEMLLCPPENAIVDCLPSQDAKNEPARADSTNQLDLRPCAPEDAEAFKGSDCAVMNEDTYEKCLLDSLDNDQDTSSQAEVEVHDIMDSNHFSFSDNAEETMACHEYPLEGNTGVEDDRCGASQDLESVRSLEASKNDNGPDPESSKCEVGNARCDLSEETGSVMTGDRNKEAADSSSERKIIEAGDGRCDFPEDMSSVKIHNMSKDVADPCLARTCVEPEDAKHSDTLVNHILTTAEDDIEDSMKETSTTADKINGSEQYVSAASKERNIEDDMTRCNTVSSELKEGNIDHLMAGEHTNGADETHAHGEDARDNIVTVSCDDDSAHSDAEIPHVDTTCSANNVIASENSTSDAKRPLPDCTSEDTHILVSDNECLVKDVQCTDAKPEKRCKRRKVLTPEASKRQTRSSSMAPSLRRLG